MTLHQAVVYSGSNDDGKLVQKTSTELPELPENRVLIKTKACAGNPTDWKHKVFNWGDKGCVPGTDSSGAVIEVGQSVSGFSVGDCVSTMTHGGYKYDKLAGCFQQYVIADPHLTINYGQKLHFAPRELIPYGPVDTWEGASSITLALVTVGMAFHYNLGLRPGNDYSEKYIVVWGGSTATGLIAIQVAKQIYGINVITTCSARNFDLVKALGADKVVDYHDQNVVNEVNSFGGEELVFGFDAFSVSDSFVKTHECLASVSPSKLTSLGMFNADTVLEQGKKVKAHVEFSMTLAYVAQSEEQNLGGAEIVPPAEVAEVFNEFWSLAAPFVVEGKIFHIPCKVISGGLDAVDEMLSALRNNKVSAEKLIIRLDGGSRKQ